MSITREQIIDNLAKAGNVKAQQAKQNNYVIPVSSGTSSGSSSRVTSDSTTARNQENTLRTDISDQLEKLRRDQERQIERERRALEERRRQEVEQIGTDFDKEREGTEFTQKREMGQTATTLARAGGFLGVTASHQGVIQNLEQTQKREITTLEDRRQAALREANNAYEDRDFELAREKLQVARDTEQEIYERQTEFDRINQNILQEEQENISKAKIQSDIFQAIDNGGKTVQEIFKALGGRVTVEEINSVLSQLKPNTGDAWSFSASNVASLLGAGMGQDDIQVLNDYINENGYDETIRAALSPAQRAAADAILREVKKVTGADSPDETLNLLDVQRIEDLYGVLFPPGISAGAAAEFITDNFGQSASEMQETINLIFGNQEAAQQGAGTGGRYIEVTEEWFRENLSTAQLKNLADLVRASKWWRYKTFDINEMFDNPEFFELLGERIQQQRDSGISDLDIITALTK